MPFVYSLSCPKSGLIIYVGKTKISLEQRLAGHMAASKREDYPLYGYIRFHKITPIISVLEEITSLDERHLYEAEKKWIKQLSDSGVILLNKQFNAKFDGEIFKYEPCEFSGKLTGIRVYEDTLNEVKNYVSRIPGMTIIRFFDEAAKEKLKLIYEQNARQTDGGTPSGESTSEQR